VVAPKKRTDFLNDLIATHGIKTIGFENIAMTVSEYNALNRALPVDFYPLEDLLTNMRAIKTEDEIANAYTALAEFGNMINPSFSLKGADDAFIEGRSYIKAGMVLARVENNVVLTPIGYLAKVVL
jgi:hypothetical protein